MTLSMYDCYEASSVAQTVKNPPAVKETQVRSLGREHLLVKKWLLTPIFLPGEFHGQRSLAGYSPWGHKESDITEQLTHIPPHTHTHTHTHDCYE